jgi:O-antigen ligase
VYETVDRRPTVALGFGLATIAVLVLNIDAGLGRPGVVLAGLLATMAVVAYRPFLPWRVALLALVVVILFIPIRRYTLPGSLPFQLEPYRLLVIVIVGAWFLSLLADPRVRLRASGIDVPLLLVAGAAIASVVVNRDMVTAAVQENVVKSLTFFLSFFFLFYVIVSLVRHRDVLLFAKVLVGGGAVVGALAVVEFRTGVNAFDHLAQVFPILQPSDVDEQALRQGKTRALGSAQHPIALGAAVVMLIPLAICLVNATGKRLWQVATLMLGLGALATLSRTSIVMLVVAGFVLLRLRPAQIKRLLPALLPLLVVTHFLLPQTIGTLVQAFIPSNIVATESRSAAHTTDLEFDPLWCNAAGRLADLGPNLDQVSQRPIFGHGYGTRLTGFQPGANACILDDQWLATALETGIFGIASWLILFLVFIRRAGREAKRDLSERGWLLAGFTASVTAYAVGMILFDAFSFIQVTFLLFIMLALGATLLRDEPPPGGEDGGLRREARAESLAGAHG